MNVEFDEIAGPFAEHYYRKLDRQEFESLAPLYTEQSMLSYAGRQCLGVKAIMETLKALPRTEHSISAYDALPCSSPEKGLLLLVAGDLRSEGDNPQKFVQTFLLGPSADSFQILNAIFRLA
jgi:hypothetical protein